jgi:hypothetical protein
MVARVTRARGAGFARAVAARLRSFAHDGQIARDSVLRSIIASAASSAPGGKLRLLTPRRNDPLGTSPRSQIPRTSTRRQAIHGLRVGERAQGFRLRCGDVSPRVMRRAARATHLLIAGAPSGALQADRQGGRTASRGPAIRRSTRATAGELVTDRLGRDARRDLRQDGIVTYDEATAKMVAIARQNGGVVTAAEIEADPDLAAEPAIVSAAGHALAGSTNVLASPSDEGWFPYAELRFTELR